MRIWQIVHHAFGIPALTKSRFGKNQSYEVLTPDQRFAACDGSQLAESTVHKQSWIFHERYKGQNLTHISLASFLWDIDKKCRQRSDTTSSSVWSESSLKIWLEKTPPITPKLEMGLFYWYRLGKSIRYKWVQHFRAHIPDATYQDWSGSREDFSSLYGCQVGNCNGKLFFFSNKAYVVGSFEHPKHMFNPLYTNGLFLLVWYNKLRIVHCLKVFFYHNKHSRPWWNGALCGISSGSSLFVKVPI